jgi:hypothetical protein
MLRASLPLGPSMDIVFNGDPLIGLRSDINIAKQWSIGSDLGLTEFAIEDEDDDEAEKIIVTAHASQDDLDVSEFKTRKRYLTARIR